MLGDKRFLLTYWNNDSHCFAWYDNELEMKYDIIQNPEWMDLDAIEIFSLERY